EVRFMRFFQNTPMAIATVDKQGRIADSNARFARLFHPVFKCEGDRSILAVVGERDRGAFEAAIRKAGGGQGEIDPVDAARGGAARGASKTPNRKAAEGQGDIDPVDAALAGPGERYASFFVTAVEGEKE